MKPKGIQSKGGSVVYGNSYTDKKTQSAMMRFLKASNKFTGNSRLGASKPKTQLNKDAKPKNDFFDNKKLKSVGKGQAQGSNYDERLSEKPLAIKKRNEKQDNKMGPRITSKRKPRVNKAGYDTRYK